MGRSSVGKAIYNILSNEAGVTDIVGTKIYPVVAPQQTETPFIVYSVVSSIPTNTKDRISEIDTMRVQVDCYEKTYTLAEALSSAVRLALDNATGTKNGVLIDGLAYENEQDFIEEDNDYFRKSIDFFVRVKY